MSRDPADRRARHEARLRERFGRTRWSFVSHDRWIEATAREVEFLEASGGLHAAGLTRFAGYVAGMALELPRRFELEEIAGPRAEVELVRGAYSRHTPEHHPLDDPSYFERDEARLPAGFREGLTFEPALPVRTSWELPLRATAGYRRRLAARRDPAGALARAAVLRAKAERLLAEARALNALSLPSKERPEIVRPKRLTSVRGRV